MSNPDSFSSQLHQMYMAPAERVYNALVQMLDVSGTFDSIHQDLNTKTVTFSSPSVTGLFTATVTPSSDGQTSDVQITVPVDAGEAAQSVAAQFYKAVGDQLITQTAVQPDSVQTTILPLNTTAAQTQVNSPIAAAPTTPLPMSNAVNLGSTSAEKGGPSHAVSHNFVKALFSDNNLGKTSVLAIASLVFGIFFIIFGCISLASHITIVVGIIFLIIAAVLCFLGYKDTEPGKKHGRVFVSIGAILSVIALILSIIGATTGESSSSASASADSSSSSCKTLIWPTGGVAAKIPAPKSNQGKVYTDSADYVDIKVCNVSEDDFASYVQQIKDKGFTVDYEGSSNSYEAKDSDGDRVYLYRSSSNKLTITLSSAAYLQEKEASKDEADQKAEEEAAAKSAEEAKKAEEAQKAAEEERKRQQEEEAKAAEEAQKAEQNNQQLQSGGVTASVKEAMDSYEAYMNKYCDFMEKYQAEGAPANMLSDYLTMLNDYTEMTKKLDSLDQNSWTDADYQYYLEMMTRVNARLSAIGGV